MFAFGMANCAIPAILGSQFQLLKCHIVPPIILANTHIRQKYIAFFYSTEGIFLSRPFKARFFLQFWKNSSTLEKKEAGDEKVLFNF